MRNDGMKEETRRISAKMEESGRKRMKGDIIIS